MDEHMNTLVDGINRWRERGVGDYWISVSYVGSAVNRFGDHDLTFVDGTFYHLWDGDWREIKRGSDFWLFSVPGAFAWARDLLTKAAAGAPPEAVELRLDDQYGYVRHLRINVARRDALNFTFDVRRFGEGAHPDFEA